MSTTEPDEGARSDEQVNAPRWDEVQEPGREDAPRWDEVQEAGSDDAATEDPDASTDP
jgi:hypothetical protein